MCTGLLPPGANPFAVKILIIIIIINYNWEYKICYKDKLRMQNAPRQCIRTLVCKPQFRNISAG